MNIIYYYLHKDKSFEYIQFPTNGDFYEISDGCFTGHIYTHDEMQTYLRLTEKTMWQTTYYYD